MKSFNWSVIASAFAFMPATLWAAGGTVENGGDTILCWGFESSKPIAPPPDIILNPNRPHGSDRFSLDYVKARKSGMGKDQFSDPLSWKESRERIEKILLTATPRLLETFQHFLLSTNEIDLSLNLSVLGQNPTRRWSPSNTELTFRESKKNIFPECGFRYTVGGATVHFLVFQRSIIRVAKNWEQGQSLHYFYNQNALNGLLENSPLQYSFLMVHEWLWDHTRSSDVNHRVNVFLHSREIDRMSPGQIRARLRRLGLKGPL
jgi:hypothetical protein